MKIWYFSDTHLDNVLKAQKKALDVALKKSADNREYQASGAALINSKVTFDPGTEADVCVVAGDFCPDLIQSIECLESISKRMPVVYIPGNRDFYTSSIFPRSMEGILKAAKARAADIGNIHILQNESVELAGVTFIGATLWSDLAGKDVEPLLPTWNDFRAIYRSSGLPFTPEDQTKEFKKSKRFILKASKQRKTPLSVVVSHTVPHPAGYPSRYTTSPYRVFMENDFSDFLETEHAPTAWIFANGEERCDAIVGNTRLLSNPCGHVTGVPEPENPNFDPGRTVTIGETAALNTWQ